MSDLSEYLETLCSKAKEVLKPINIDECEYGKYIITASFNYAFVVHKSNNKKVLECYRTFPGLKKPKFKSGDETTDGFNGEYFLTTKDFIDCLYEVVEEKLYWGWMDFN